MSDGSNQTYTYQWFLNGQPISGATGKTFTKTNAQVADAGTYKVTVNAAGAQAPADSNNITVTVNAPATTSVAGKVIPVGKIGGDTLTAAELFTYGGTPVATIANVGTVTGTGGTWDNTAKTLKLSDTASGNLTFTFTVTGGATKGTDITINGVTPKLTSFTATAAPVALTAGTAGNDYALDGGTVAAPAAATTLTLVGVPAGAVVPTPVVANAVSADTSIATTTVTGGKIVITPLAKAGTSVVTITLGGVSKKILVTVA